VPWFTDSQQSAVTFAKRAKDMFVRQRDDILIGCLKAERGTAAHQQKQKCASDHRGNF
jgi:hypothetical protein